MDSIAAEAVATVDAAPPLSANRDFRWFWYGQAVSSFGDGFAMVAMPLLVLEATDSVTQMGVVTALAAAGQIVMSLFAGLILDRVHRRRLMIATDIGRMLLYGSLPIAWSFHTHRLALIYFVAFFGAALGNLFSVGYIAAISNLVGRPQLAHANSRLQATTALTFVFGPLAAGALCTRFGTSTALWADAISFAVSAASLSLVRFGADAIASRRHEGGMLADLLAGLHFAIADKVLRGATIFMSTVGLLASAGIGAAVIDLFIFQLRHDLHEGSAVVGACLGVSAIGAVAGAILSPRVRRRWGSGAGFFGGTALQAVGLLAAGALPFVGGTILAGVLWSAGLTLRAVVGISLRQERAPDELLGRVTSAVWICSFATSSIGSVLVTRVAGAAGTARALTLIGVALAATAAFGVASRFLADVRE